MFPKVTLKTTTQLFSIASVIFLSFPNLALAQSQTTTNNPDNQEEAIADLVPDRRKGGASRRPQPPTTSEEDTVAIPQRRKPAASRPVNNYCDFNPQQLTALIPKNLVGATATNHPTLFFSVPEIPANTEIEFVLRGPNDELVEEKRFSGAAKAGLMSITLPRLPKSSTTDAPSNYRWYLSVICNPDDRAYDIVVEGIIQPITLTTEVRQQIESATLTEQVELYQNHQVWHETLNALAELKRSQPQNATVLQMWADLLKSVDLDPVIGQQPLLDPEILTFNY